MLYYIATTTAITVATILYINIISLKKKIETQKKEIIEKDRELILSNAKLDSAQESYNQLSEQYKTKLPEAILSQLKNISHEALQWQSDKFLSSSSTGIKGIIDPLKESLERDLKNIKETQKNLNEEHILLKDLIKPLPESIDKFTSGITGNFKLNGDFGEMMLERLLQYCGFQREVHYELQKSIQDEEGNTLRPDCLFYLPDKRSIVIDVKTPLRHSMQYHSATDTAEEKNMLIEKHAEAIKGHIKNLSEKRYQSFSKTIFDFVIMFVPSDYALFSAYTIDPQLQTHAFKDNIVIVSPTLFLPFIQIVANSVRLNKINENAANIAKLGGSMYGKIEGIFENMEKIYKRANSIRQDLDEMRNKIEGKGGIKSSAEKMKLLGAKTTKTLPN